MFKNVPQPCSFCDTSSHCFIFSIHTLSTQPQNDMHGPAPIFKYLQSPQSAHISCLSSTLLYRSMILRTSSKMDGPRSRSKTIRDSDRDMMGDTAGDSQFSLRRSSLLSPASESKLKPRFGSSGPQLSEMESSDDSSDIEPVEGTKCGKTGIEAERVRS